MSEGNGQKALGTGHQALGVRLTMSLVTIAAMLLALAVSLLADQAARAQSGHGTGVYLTDGGDRMVVQAHGTLELQAGATISTAIGAGAIGVSSTGFTLVETGDGVTHQTTLTLDEDFEFFIVDAGANGAHGSVKLYTFPVGYIKITGATTNLALDCVPTNGLVDAATYDIGIGSITAGVDNAALATTEQNIIAKIEGNMSGATVASIHGINATSLAIDGTSTAEDAWFNVAIEADDAADDQLCTLSGTVTITWTNLGDY